MACLPAFPRSHSTSDLHSVYRHLERSQEHRASIQDSIAEGLLLKPIKRSRSDQSLADGACHASAQHDRSLAVQYCSDGGRAPPSPFVPVPRMSPLPVVFSDHGSSCNSLISLESDSTRCSSGALQSLLQTVHAAGHGGAPGANGANTSRSGTLAQLSRTASRPGEPGTSTMVASASAVSLNGGQQLVRGYSLDSLDEPSPALGHAALGAQVAELEAPAARLGGSQAATAAALVQPAFAAGAPTLALAAAVGSSSSIPSSRRQSGEAGPSLGNGTIFGFSLRGASADAEERQVRSGPLSPQLPDGSALANGRSSSILRSVRTSRPEVADFGSKPVGLMLPPASQSSGEWDFKRRHLAAATPSTPSTRRRSSIEASMPWRQQVDAAIARASHEDRVHISTPRQSIQLPTLPTANEEEGEEEEEETDGFPEEEEDEVAELSSGPGSPYAHDADGGSGWGAAAALSAGGMNRSRSYTEAAAMVGSTTEQAHIGSLPHGKPAGGRRLAGGSSLEFASIIGEDLAARQQPASTSGREGQEGQEAAQRRRAAAGNYLTQGSAGLELFLRLARARQTLDFTKRQAQLYAELNHAELSVWEALGLLGDLRDHESALWAPVLPPGEVDPEMSMKEHAFQVAELCRLAFPDRDWLHLVGLIHSLGKLLAHSRFGLQPQWAVCGETYPLGCRFATQVDHHEYFSANPDRRRRAYSTPLGVYQPKCGLRNVYMSWGGPEYLYMVLVLNQVHLPDEALFIIRYQRFLSLTRPGGAYQELVSPEDAAMIPLLAAFQKLSVFRRVELPPEALRGQAFVDYYQGLIRKYLGEEKLFF